jgi:hypothetical protein
MELPTWTDSGRHLEIRMAANKPEVETFLERKELSKQFLSATNAFATNHKSDRCVSADTTRHKDSNPKRWPTNRKWV